MNMLGKWGGGGNLKEYMQSPHKHVLQHCKEADSENAIKPVLKSALSFRFQSWY